MHPELFRFGFAEQARHFCNHFTFLPDLKILWFPLVIVTKKEGVNASDQLTKEGLNAKR